MGFGGSYYGGWVYGGSYHAGEAVPIDPPPAEEVNPLAGDLLLTQEVYEALGPVAQQDEANGFALLALVRAIASMGAQVEEAVRAIRGYGPWSQIWDPDRCPVWLLPWSAQAHGVRLRPGGEAAQREQIKAQSAWKRHQPEALIAAVQTTLTGTQRVRLTEASAYAFIVVTRPSETPDPGRTELVGNVAKPVGTLISYVVADLPVIDEGTRIIDNAKEGTIDTATLAQVT